MAGRTRARTPSRETGSSERPHGSSGASGADPSFGQTLPRFDEVGDDFFEELYLALNPDIREATRAGIIPSGQAHWSVYGQFERANSSGLRSTLTFTSPSRSVIDMMSLRGHERAGFDPFGYLYANPDVLKATDGSAEAATNHWIKHGREEGRVAPGVLKPNFRDVDVDRLLARPFGINVFGPFGAASGLGTAARAMAKAVKVSGIPFELNTFDMTSGELRHDSSESRPGPKFRVNVIIANADTVVRVFAAYRPGFFDDAYNIAVWQWELASPRSDTFYAFNGLDEIWTNSAFQATAIAAVAPVPVTRIHIPVEAPRTLVAPDRAGFGIPEGQYVFYMPFDVGSTSARKNPFGVIDAFLAVHAEKRAAHLVLKYHSAKHEEGFVRKLLAAIKGSPAITVISEALSLPQLDVLRACCDCLVSAHRSEGFGLNIAEFMSLGKAVIATAYSGNLDFFDASSGFPIDYELVELVQPSGPYQPGFIWSEPSTQNLKNQMLRVIEDADEVARRGKMAAERIRQILGIEVVGRSISARISALQLDVPVPAFARTIAKGDRATKRPLSALVRVDGSAVATLRHRLLLSVVMPVYNVPARYLRECIGSVLAQSYPLWELCICDDCSTEEGTINVLDEYRGVSPMIKMVRNERNAGISNATNKAIQIATGNFVVFLDNDDILEPDALDQVARAVSADPTVDVIYSDEIKIDGDGKQIDHYYKPDWSPEHLESVMYVLHLLVVRKKLLLEVGSMRAEYTGAQDYDLMLRCSRATSRIHHIPKALYRWRAIPGSAAAVVDAKPTALENGKRALADHAGKKYGPLAKVESGLLPGTFRLRRGLPFPPQVSLLILTGNARLELPEKGEVSLVENLVASIRAKTDYPNYRVVIVDNSTLSPEQVLAFEADRVVVKNFRSEGAFNYAAKANFAVRTAHTENIVLMNDDMEVIRPDWLTSLVELSTDPGIGAVGARLLHLDGTIQHVGTVLGVNDSVAHVYHSFPGDLVGYNGFTHLIRNYSAVTAACLATRKSVVSQAGWFDEDLAIDFNDIDLCLRISAMGYRVVYTPYAELFHFEGISAKRTAQDPAEVALFCGRWHRVLANDPFYNPNLTRRTLDFAERAG